MYVKSDDGLPIWIITLWNVLDQNVYYFSRRKQRMMNAVKHPPKADLPPIRYYLYLFEVNAIQFGCIFVKFVEEMPLRHIRAPNKCRISMNHSIKHGHNLYQNLQLPPKWKKCWRGLKYLIRGNEVGWHWEEFWPLIELAVSLIPYLRSSARVSIGLRQSNEESINHQARNGVFIDGIGSLLVMMMMMIHLLTHSFEMLSSLNCRCERIGPPVRVWSFGNTHKHTQIRYNIRILEVNWGRCFTYDRWLGGKSGRFCCCCCWFYRYSSGTRFNVRKQIKTGILFFFFFFFIFFFHGKFNYFVMFLFGLIHRRALLFRTARRNTNTAR